MNLYPEIDKNARNEAAATRGANPNTEWNPSDAAESHQGTLIGPVA